MTPEEKKKYQHEWYLKNKEKCKEKDRKWYENNKQHKHEYDQKRYEEKHEELLKQKREYYSENREEIRTKQKEYYDRTIDERQEAARQYRKEHVEERREYDKEYNKTHPDIRNAGRAKYRASKNQAIPAWANLDKIKEIYKKCIEMNKNTDGVKYVVDHIIPLQGENVCGFHVENNLQIITEIKNLQKSNKFDPELYPEQANQC